MSILEKLKDLVTALETEDKSQPPPVPDVAPEDEIALEEQDIVEEVEIQETPAYLECSNEESRHIFARIENVKLAKIALAELTLLIEKKKRKFISEISERNEEFLNDLESLRLEYGIPEQGYTVQLPTSQDEKVSFIKS